MNEKKLKVYRIIMVIFDIIAIPLIIFQIINKDIYYPSWIILILTNILIFTIKKEN